MILTIPLGSRRRITVALTRRRGIRAVAWRRGFEVDRPGDDEDGGAGVREPRRPIGPSGAGSVSLPLE